MRTICIDIINTLVVKEDIQEADIPKSMKSEYIILKNNLEDCCRTRIAMGSCKCVSIYSIKPHAINFLRSIYGFYEVICFSKLPSKSLKSILNHLERVLNEHVPKVQSKLYFRYSIAEESMFYKIDQFDEWIPNLHLLLGNREHCNIFLLTSNTIRIICAQALGFCILPVVNSPHSRNFEL